MVLFNEHTRAALKKALDDPFHFALLGGISLRTYQRRVAAAISDSVLHGRGGTFVVMFPRQSGKNELQAQLESFFLMRCQRGAAEMVKISPTWKPQSQNAMRRLQGILSHHPLLRERWRKDSGYRFSVGAASITFLSGSAEANIVGATASLLLQVDEAQDISIEKYDKEIAPMAASTNATRVFWGTAWDEDTLLARELRLAQQEQEHAGKPRAFVLSADQVAREVPAYGEFVRRQVEMLGRDHPLVRTQFFSELLESGGRLFDDGRLALMAGQHPMQSSPLPGEVYVFCLDVAGEDGGLAQRGALANPQRDFTALTIFSLHSQQSEWGFARNHYRILWRIAWQGLAHNALFDNILALARRWQPRHVVVDAGGVGAGISSFLQSALPGRVIPFHFTLASKSKLGWDFLALIDSGRLKDHRDASPEKLTFLAQARACKSSISATRGRVLRWYVPAATRDENGKALHDDWLVSAALVAVLEGQSLAPGLPTAVIRAADPLREIDFNRFRNDQPKSRR